MLKQLVVLLIFLFFSKNLISQEKSDSVVLKRGIYKTKEELLNNTPSILTPFSFTLFSVASKNGDLNYYTKGYQFDDSSKPQKKVFGFCDGNNVYVRIKEYEKGFNEHKFYRLNHLGKFPFIALSHTTIVIPFYNTMPILALGVAAYTASSPQTEVWYFNKKGVLRIATEQAFYFLLEEDKDLYKEFVSEKHKNSNEYIKYLLKMNERYTPKGM